MYYNNPSVHNIPIIMYHLLSLLLQEIDVRHRPRITRGSSDEHSIFRRGGSSPVNRIAIANESWPDGNTSNASAAASLQPAGDKRTMARQNGIDRAIKWGRQNDRGSYIVWDGRSELLCWTDGGGASERCASEKTERNDKDGKYGYRRPGNGCYVMVTAWLVFRHPAAAAYAVADRPGWNNNNNNNNNPTSESLLISGARARLGLGLAALHPRNTASTAPPIAVPNSRRHRRRRHTHTRAHVHPCP